jgi:hypothetical protein
MGVNKTSDLQGSFDNTGGLIIHVSQIPALPHKAVYELIYEANCISASKARLEP